MSEIPEDVRELANEAAAAVRLSEPGKGGEVIARAIMADRERRPVGEPANLLSNLLARIHRDGGHYEAKHGTAKAVEDADQIVADIYAGEPVAFMLRSPDGSIYWDEEWCLWSERWAAEDHASLLSDDDAAFTVVPLYAAPQAHRRQRNA